MQDSFETCPPLDIVIVGAHNLSYTPNPAEIAFVRKSYENCKAFISVCGGILVPLQAGILDGKTATGPRFMLDVLRQQSPSTNWLEKRWLRDGKLWTAGALLNGMDLMAAFAQEYWGGEGTLATKMSSMGSWVNRDLDYKDEQWTD